MLRPLAPAVLILILLLSACGGGGGPSDASSPPTSAGPGETAEPTPSPAAPEVEAGAAVLIVLGDSGTYACCGAGASSIDDLTTYMATQLGQPVETVSIEEEVSAQEFIAGAGGEASLLARGVSAIEQYQADGHPVAGIVLSVGAADIDHLRRDCEQGCQPQALEDLAVRYSEQLRVIYSRLNQAMVQAVPILQPNFYDAETCAGAGADTPVGFKLDGFNQKMAEEAADKDGFVVDIAAVIKPGMCLGQGRLTSEGQRALESAFETVYDSVPDTFRPAATP